nr:glycosyltransferase [Lachnospiraceae bacterium]
MDKIAVLIPCYNESKTIAKVIQDFREELPEATIYVYDNNSTDETDRIARENGAVVRYERRQGKGNVIRRMFREIDAECYLMVDGDDTYPADCAKEMVRKVFEENADMVIGDRLSSTYFKENKRPFHNVGNIMVRKSINLLFKANIKDMMTGYRAFGYEFVKTFPVLSNGFEIETEMSIHAAEMGMQIDNVVIEYRDRPEGSVSKLNTYRDGYKVMRMIFHLFRNYKPLQFFSTISVLLTALSLGFFVPVLWEYFQTGMVGRFPTLIVCSFVLIAAILSVFTGLILSSIVHKNRQDFEDQLKRAYERKQMLIKEK